MRSPPGLRRRLTDPPSGEARRYALGVPRAIAVLGLALLACRAPLERFEYEVPAMGTSFRIVLHAEDEAQAAAAAGAAFARVRELESIFSDYDPESEARLVAERGPGVALVSPELLEVTALALNVSARSGGAFDVTVGPLTRLWRRALRQESAPDADQLEEARAAVGWEKVRVDMDAQTLELSAAGMRLDYGGIAKGYALGAALQVLGEHGVDRALVDGGGDVACGEAPPGEPGWIIELKGGDREALLVRGFAVATSGHMARGGVLDGASVSHLIDPRPEALGRALPARSRIATVMARDAALADALASTLLVLDPEEGVHLLAGYAEAEARIVTETEQGRRVFTTAGFPWLLSLSPRPVPPLRNEP